MKSPGKRRDTSFMRDRWQLFAAATGSLLLHALVLLGFAGAPAPDTRVVVGKAPIQAQFIARPRVIEAAVVPAVVPATEQAAPPKTRATPEAEEPRTGRTAAAAAVARPAAPQNEPPAYRQGAELDPPPRPLGDIDPEYPAAAGLTEGTVVLRLLIGADGRVDEVIVVSAYPQGVFEASALAAFGKATFSPGRHLGVPVRSQVTIEVEYTPVNRGSAVSGSSGLGTNR